MGHMNIIQHEINLKPGVTPYYTPGTRRFAPAELEAIYENLQEELKVGKIIESEGPWCAPIVVAKKKGVSIRTTEERAGTVMLSRADVVEVSNGGTVEAFACMELIKTKMLIGIVAKKDAVNR